MVDQQTFQEFMGQVVRLSLPSETLAYEVDGSRMVDDLFCGRSLSPTKADRSIQYEFAGGVDAQELLQIPVLLAATFGLVKSIDSYIRDRKADRLAEQQLAVKWKDELVKAGLSEEKVAELIATTLLLKLSRAASPA